MKYLLQIFICGLVLINTNLSDWTTFQSFIAIILSLILVEVLAISAKLGVLHERTLSASN